MTNNELILDFGLPGLNEIIKAAKTPTRGKRAYHGPDDGERLTYIESLKAELKHHNQWIYPGEWTVIEKWLPSISEEDAKEQCFIIREKIRERVDYDRHLYE
jgi:hypothetical protein